MCKKTSDLVEDGFPKEVHCRYTLHEESHQINIVGNAIGHMGPQGVLTEGCIARRL